MIDIDQLPREVRDYATKFDNFGVCEQLKYGVKYDSKMMPITDRIYNFLLRYRSNSSSLRKYIKMSISLNSKNEIEATIRARIGLPTQNIKNYLYELREMDSNADIKELLGLAIIYIKLKDSNKLSEILLSLSEKMDNN
ncbi:gp495 [Bacillus phage G]|uniref:Gp495 n=1 Tax=Bacillus phage G TaxID=2884420 RepID=G3MAN6_9CAUD|nr:gp495 [Bacillus phage G]AEO93753.1 gp495 [Bacillus phage G]